MPIRPEERRRYPVDWRAISDRIRFDRAGGRCECEGECGSGHAGRRCAAEHGEPHPITRSPVILTVAHRNHRPEDCDDENLMAACQKSHLSYDRHNHAATRRRRKAAS